MKLGIVIISLAVSCLIVDWLSMFIKKMKVRKLTRLIIRIENNIQTHKIMMGIFGCCVPESLYKQGDLCISKLEFLAEKLNFEPIISRVKKIREDHSKLKVNE